ncbi:MAG TPA: DUF106 domain-containing protein [Euryarchaeota archaeon]|nr:DUF106 domain-containing protein [Euryarchaeota archaeon]
MPGESSGKQAPASGAPTPNVGNQMLIMLVLFMAIILLFSGDTRTAIGKAVGYVLYPVFGFGGSFPLITLMLTGMMMTLLSTLLRHFFVDWVEMARNQRIVSAFNKELRKARLDNNMYKIKKLTEIQQDIMAKSLSATQTQMKLMPISMFVIIPIFAWVWVFVSETIPTSAFSVPWELNASLERSHIFPNWILVYSLVTIPFGQVVSRILKFFSFRKRLSEIESGEGALNADNN